MSSGGSQGKDFHIGIMLGCVRNGTLLSGITASNTDGGVGGTSKYSAPDTAAADPAAAGISEPGGIRKTIDSICK